MTELEKQLLAAFEQQQALIEQLQRDYGQELAALQQQVLELAERRPREPQRPPAGQSPCATCRHSWIRGVQSSSTGVSRSQSCLLGGRDTWRGIRDGVLHDGDVLECSLYEP